MRVALEVWSANYDQVESTCVLADSLGFDGFYYGESPNHVNLDCWTTLAGLARVTDRIRLGPVITNVLPTYRSHILLAKQAATVAAMSRNRVDFRTGVGASLRFARAWWEPFGVTYPGYDERLSDLAAALVALRRSWSSTPQPDSVGITNGPPAPGEAGQLDIPITIAARGERAMQLGAAMADTWETSFCTPAEFAMANDQFSKFADGRTVERSLEIDGFVSCTPPGLDRLLRRVRSERGVAEELAPLLERAIVGVPSEAADHLRALEAAGVDQVVVALHDPHDRDALEALAQVFAMVRQ